MRNNEHKIQNRYHHCRCSKAGSGNRAGRAEGQHYHDGSVGDGGGKLPVPDAGQTGLIHEVWRHALNKISQDKRNSNYIIAELVIPPEVGGFWMRELGLYDDAGTLIAVANIPKVISQLLPKAQGVRRPAAWSLSSAVWPQWI